MEPWYSGAIIDAVSEAKSRQALFIVYVRDDSEQSQSMDNLWSDLWNKLNDTSKIVALRLDKDNEACKQFMAIYKVQIYPTTYFIDGRNGQALKVVDQSLENSDKLQEIVENSLNIIEQKQASPPPTATTAAPSKTVEEKVAEARARLKEIHDKREDEAKEKEKQDEVNRRRLGQQMLLDKQKKDEELIRKQAEEVRRDKLEQQKLQEKLKAQIQQDREEKRRKYEQESITQTVKPKVTTTNIETPKINYTRSRLQFRLTDGSFFTEDFPIDAHMSDVYTYLNETLPSDQYKNGSYILRTTHTRISLTRDNPNTLQELELVPSAVLLVINRGNNNNNNNSSSTSLTSNNIFQSIPLIFTWFMMQFNFIYQFIFSKLFGNPTPTPSTEQVRPTTRINNPTKKENFRTDSTEKTTIRRFHNTQDDSDDEEKRTWNEVPDSIKTFQKLELFNAACNQLNKVSEELAHLAKFKTVILSHYHIFKSPENIYNIKDFQMDDQVPPASFGIFSLEFAAEWEESNKYEDGSDHFEIWVAHYEEILQLPDVEKYCEAFRESQDIIGTCHDGILVSLFEMKIKQIEENIIASQLSDEEVRLEMECVFNFYRL